MTDVCFFFLNFENYLSMHPGFSMERFKVILQNRAEISPARIQKQSSGDKAPWFALPNCSGKSNHECKLSREGE